MSEPPPPPGKAALRRELLAARAVRGPDGGAAAGQLLDLLGGVRRIASYVFMPLEASTTSLHNRCGALGIEVLLPRLLASGDLELAAGPTVPGLRGTQAPTGAAVGWNSVDLVVVPALAVLRAGVRLGRGGGSYDRALPRVRPGVPVVALLTDAGELRDVPAEPHDVAVSAVALPSGLVWVGARWHT